MMADVSRRLAAALIAASLLAVAGPAAAQTAPAPAPAGDQGGHGRQGQHGAASHGSAGEPASTRAFRETAERMHDAMDVPMTGDADVDFARGMIGHHQGAIDMARIQLEHGQDPELRQLAEEIIAAQEREIAFLKEWLARKGK